MKCTFILASNVIDLNVFFSLFLKYGVETEKSTCHFILLKLSVKMRFYKDIQTDGREGGDIGLVKFYQNRKEVELVY